MGIYDECVDVRYPVIGQYCLSDIKLKSLVAKDYSFNRTEDLDDFGNKNAWKTVLGVRKFKYLCISNQIFFIYIYKQNIKYRNK